MRRLGAVTIPVAVMLAASCNLVLTDYKTTSSGDISTSTSSGGLVGEPAAPLELAQDGPSGPLAVSRADRFRLETDAESHWQWARLAFLNGGAEVVVGPEDHAPSPYYRTLCLWTAARGEDGMNHFHFRSCRASTSPEDVGEPASEAPDPIVEDATPVWVTLSGSVTCARATTVTFTTRVYASGLVWSSSAVLVDDDTNEYDTSNITLGYGLLAFSNGQFVAPTAREPGLFRALGSPGGILSLDTDEQPATRWEPNVIDDDPSGIWLVEPETLVDQVAKTYRSAFLIGAQDQLAAELSQRANDARSPALELTGGVPAPGTIDGRDPDTGTYSVDVADGANEVRLTLGASMDRFEPAFELRGWAAPTFSIRLAGVPVATHVANGPDALAKLANGKLVFQYLRSIPAAADEASRTFVVAAE